MKDSVLQAAPILERMALHGRTALVTGGGQGIGRSYAHALAEAGAKVAVVDINLEAAETVSHEITEKGGAAMALLADVTREDSINAALKKIIDSWGMLTIGVNNAGTSIWTNAEEHDPKDWEKIISLNLTGTFYCCKNEANIMLEKGYGKIINTASMSGHIVNTPQNQTAYNTSKAAVLHMTKSLAAEWSTRGVRVNSISPGYTKTKLVADLLETEVGKKVMPKWMGMTPMGSMLDVTDLQGAVVYLASSASDFMTGADLLIDGGYCIW